MWAKPWLCPSFWASMMCQRWQIAWAAHVLCLIMFQRRLFSASILCCHGGFQAFASRCSCRAVVHIVKIQRGCSNSYTSLSIVWRYPGIWSSVSATCCWSSWSQNHVTGPSRNPCCRAWAETQTRTVITHDQDGITHFYVWIVGWRLSKDGNTDFYFVPYIILVLLSHLCQENHGNCSCTKEEITL